MPQRARHRTRRLDARTWQWSKRTASSSETCSTAATSCASTRTATCPTVNDAQRLLKVESHVERLLEHRDNPARRERVTAELEEPVTPIDAGETQDALECFREQATDIDEVIATPRVLARPAVKADASSGCVLAAADRNVSGRAIARVTRRTGKGVSSQLPEIARSQEWVTL